MSNVQTPPAAAPPPQPPPVQPTGRMGVVKARLDNVGAVVTVLAGIGGMLAAGVATTGGYVQSAWDWMSSADQTASQVTAIDERLKAVEGEGERIAADRAETARLARALEKISEDLARAGVAVDGLQAVQRQLELRVERMDAILGIMREGR